MLTFTVDANAVLKAMRAHVADFDNPSGVFAQELRLGMQEVYDRVNKRFQNLYKGPRRRYIDSKAGYTDKAAPRVVKSRIVDQLRSEKQARFHLTANRGMFVLGLGNVEELDVLTGEEIISSIKAARQETPEQKREFPGRTLHSIWRIIEFGAKPHPISPIASAGSPYSDDPYYSGGLMFFSHRQGSIAFADRTQHPGQSGKHVFLRTEHEVYQKDIGAITSAALRGLKRQVDHYYK